jgi:hypothetical protein
LARSVLPCIKRQARRAASHARHPITRASLTQPPVTQVLAWVVTVSGKNGPAIR